MESGNIVEFIDRQKIMCAVVLEIKNERLRLLTENDREVKLSKKRLSHKSDIRLDLAMGRTQMVSMLKTVAEKRRDLIKQVDIQELWEVLNSEQEWIDLPTMTAFCFPHNPSFDHESAVVRAFFKNRLYFKFNANRFFPNTEEQVEQISARAREEERQERITKLGSDLIKAVLAEHRLPLNDHGDIYHDVVDCLKSYYLFGKESPHKVLAKAILARAGIKDAERVFPILVKMGVFDVDENVELLRNGIRVEIPATVIDHARELVHARSVPDVADGLRRDFTHLELMTIDGQATLDYDDAISIEVKGDHYLLGVHIVDVGDVIAKNDPIDIEAAARGSSIYMPDQKISMLPTALAEDLCSLKAGQVRPAISILAEVKTNAEVVQYEIVASLIKVRHQLSYYDVNTVAGEDPRIKALWGLAKNFRSWRLTNKAIQINLPEIHIWLDEQRQIGVTRVNRESPGRMLVSELMIMANWLMARFLSAHQCPAVFRSQPGPRERLFEGENGTLFQNWMQRRHLSRFVLSPQAEPHTGLGLEAYVTATSPIRKYYDLVTQRQIRAALGLEDPYSPDEIDQIMQRLEIPMANVFRTQSQRSRYWLLKYLEGRVGGKEPALVLGRRRNSYQVLLTEYMLECELPLSGGMEFKPEDVLEVTLQRVDARKGVLTIFIS